MDDGVIRLGVTGRGGLGLFALQQFTQVSGIKLIATACEAEALAHRAGGDR